VAEPAAGPVPLLLAVETASPLSATLALVAIWELLTTPEQTPQPQQRTVLQIQQTREQTPQPQLPMQLRSERTVLQIQQTREQTPGLMQRTVLPTSSGVLGRRPAMT